MKDSRKRFYIWVKKRLLDEDLTVSALADEIGYPRRTVSAAIHGTPFPHVIQSIATHLRHDPTTDGPLPVGPARPERRIRIHASRPRRRVPGCRCGAG